MKMTPITAAPVDENAFQFGPQQEVGIQKVNKWMNGHKSKEETPLVFRLFGFAGTGKTTIARHLAASVKGRVCYAAYTGKAALMMQRSGCDGASTIHSLLYTAKTNPDGSMVFVRNRQSDIVGASLIVIDECSMVDDKIGADLESFGVPILVLGDPAQLPPVNGKGYFTHGHTPDVMLTEIHRQARDNPIIRIATDVREGRVIQYGDYGTVIIDRPGNRSAEDVLAADQIIVGKNRTRGAFNTRIRKYLGRENLLPEMGDRLVCLRNDSTTGLLNGGLFSIIEPVKESGRKHLVFRIASDDEQDGAKTMVKVRREFFEGGADKLTWKTLRGTQQFDYGYALTGHKSQGSQWANVLAYDESNIFGEDARAWLYTVITRASETLTLIR